MKNIVVEYGADGKLKFKSIYAKTIDELEKKVAAFKLARERGVVIDDKNLTLEKWAWEWFKTFKCTKAYNTQKMYENIIKAHIAPELGHIKLRELKTFHLQALINRRVEAGLTRTVEKIKLTLDQILKSAVKNELLYKNAMDAVEVPRFVKPEKRALTERELSYIAAAGFTPQEAAFVYLLLYTGLRKSEALALTRADINLGERKITVNKTVVHKGNAPTLSDKTKTEKSARSVPVIDALFPALKEYLSEYGGITMFAGADGGIMTHSAFRRFWLKIFMKINKAAGGDERLTVIAPDITPHIFRHTFATSLL